MTATLIEEVRQALRDLAGLTSLTDPHLNEDGLTHHRRTALAGIRARLARHMPAEVPVPDRTLVLKGLAPKTADDLAFQAREWEKVTGLMGAGQTLGHVIASAERGRLAAILDNMEVLAVGRPEEDIEGIHAAIWARLVEVDASARGVASAEQAAAPLNAWRSILQGLIDTGQVQQEGMSLLHQADRVEWNLLQDGIDDAITAIPQGQVVRLVEALDAPDPVGAGA